MIATAVPVTFGLKFGPLVLCFVTIGGEITKPLFLFIEPQAIVIYSVGFAFTIGAILVCACGFKETLDIKSLIEKRLVYFENFGIRMDEEQLNYSKIISEKASLNSVSMKGEEVDWAQDNQNPEMKVQTDKRQ